jgi:hypothetical protein
MAYARSLRRLEGRSRRLLDAGRAGHRLGPPALARALRRQRRRSTNGSSDGHGEHLLERGGPPCRGRARRPHRHHPRQPRDPFQAAITYAELRDRVASLAGALRAKGIEKGDRVIIYMPMVPEALEAMLACARLGAIHSVVFGGFAARTGHPDRRRQAQGDHRRLLRDRAGRVVHYKPLVDGAIDMASTSPSSA